jgi:hypothetical protein
MWPHEYGHWSRANQFGGDFIIEDTRFPTPKARMVSPVGIQPFDMTYLSVGGFEINNLIRKQIHTEFYSNGYAYADELIHSFINEVFYPAYAFMFTPADPTLPDTWINTMGDPVESVLLYYKSYSGRPALLTDGRVDPDLVKLYNETVQLSFFWMLLDPMLYKSAEAFSNKERGKQSVMRPDMLVNGPVSWTYSTMFNPSPLGYELYLTNYFVMNDKLYTLYLKAGKPFKNIGFGIEIPKLIQTEKYSLGVGLDLWDQDVYGTGAAISAGYTRPLNTEYNLVVNCIFKTRGYVLGQRAEQNLTLRTGLSYIF